MNFGMCNIWVIRRRNVIYLYSKKPHLDQLFHCQTFRIRCHSVNFWYIPLMTSYPETLTVKKLIKMEFFTIKIYYISSSNDPNITHTKSYTTDFKFDSSSAINHTVCISKSTFSQVARLRIKNFYINMKHTLVYDNGKESYAHTLSLLG